MTQSTTAKAGAANQRGAGVRGVVFGLAFFSAGAALSAWCFLRAPTTAPTGRENAGPATLSAGTTAVLQHLGSPVELRYYCLLDPTSVGESGRAFSDRVDALLSRYEQQGGGKITISRFNSSYSAAAQAALADGMKPFNLDKGDACYLGVAVASGSHIETFPSLAPEWEAALESDLSRAIARVAAANSAVASAPAATPAALKAVKGLISNVDSISVEEGANVLRQASYDQFKTEINEMQARIKGAEDRFLQAEADHSEEGQAAARKELQQIQADYLVKLRRLTTSAQAQGIALQQLKAASQ